MKLILAKVPIRTFDALFHVGSLDAEAGEVHTGLEGPCLAASLHPEAWTRIAKLGGLPVWRLSINGRGVRLYDLLAMPEDLKLQIHEYAVNQRLLIRAPRVRAWFYNCESDDCGGCEPGAQCTTCDVDDGWRYMEFDSEEKARQNADEEGLRPCGGPVVEPVMGYTASDDLARWWTGSLKNSLSSNMAATAAVVFLLEQYGDADGVWWDELLDPDALSAPRAGLFQKRLNGFVACSVDGVTLRPQPRTPL